MGVPTPTGGSVGSIILDVGMNDPPPTGGSVESIILDVGMNDPPPTGGSVGSTIIVGISVSVVGTGAGGTG
jgi:hypothetical protein